MAERVGFTSARRTHQLIGIGPEVGETGVLEIQSIPELEIDQDPQTIVVISLAVHVLRNEPMHVSAIEDIILDESRFLEQAFNKIP